MLRNLLSMQKRQQAGENDEDGTTSLHSAVQMGNTVMARGLINSRAVEIDAEDSKGRTALHYAMEQASPELASLLLSAGAHPDAVDFGGSSAAHFAARDGMLDAMVEQFLECGIGWGCLRHAGDTHTASALHLAARHGHVQICHRLIHNGWDLNRVTGSGSALHEAAAYGRIQVVRFLLHVGIDTRLTNNAGLTAAELAKKTASRNPITYKEVRYLLKECRNFLYGEAVREFNGERADELTFNEGDLIWIIQRGSENDPRWKGVIFGSKANSRSGYFSGSAVKIVDRPVIQPMSSRVAGPAHVAGVGSSFIGATPRQAKKVAPPVAPPLLGMTPVLQHKGGGGGDYQRPQYLGAAQSTRSLASPMMSDTRSQSSDTSSGNRTPRPTHMPANVSTFTCYSSHGKSSTGAGMPCVVGATPSTLLPGAGVSECYRNSTGSNSSQASSGFESMKGGPASASTSSSSFHASTASPLAPSASNLGSPPSRSSVHSSGSSGNGSATSSLASNSVDALDDSHYAAFHSPSSVSSREPPPSNVDVTAMVASGVPEAEILAIWLDKLGLSEYLSMFLTQGYDLSTIARITPEDLTALGIASPTHRKRLIAEIHSWQITDSWPLQPPAGGLREWLVCLGLPEYIQSFESQGYQSLIEVQKLCWEDFEDIGIKRLGHLKRLGLAIKKLKDYRQGRLAQAEQGINGMKLITVQPSKQQARPATAGSTHVVAHVHPQPAATSHHSPPPPAPSSTFHTRHNMNAPIDYLSYARAGKQQQPPPPVRGASTERSNNGYGVIERKPTNGGLGGTSAMRRSVEQHPAGYDSLFETHEPIRLNLVKAEQILSEPTAIRRHANGDSSDHHPPPPAPLSCEGSIRRLQSVSSACSSGSASSSMEQLPFANDNCGTIRSREPNGRPKTASQSQPQTPRRALSSTFVDEEMSIATSNGGSNVLNDIGYMLQNLTEELDAMLVPQKQAMPTSFPVKK